MISVQDLLTNWKEIQVLCILNVSSFKIHSRAFAINLCFPSTLITSGCSLTKPSGLALLVLNQAWTWGSWSKLLAEDLVSGFLGLICTISFFVCNRFPGACQENKVVLPTIWRNHQNITPWYWGIMVFWREAFAFTSPSFLKCSPQPSPYFSGSLKIDITLHFEATRC